MRNALLNLDFDNQTIRIIETDLEQLWVAKDVCIALGYRNHNDAISRHCRGVVKRYPLLSGGGTQNVRVINEANLMRLIVHCRLPIGEKFERWIFEEVIPSIRRTRSYSASQIPDAQKLLAENLQLQARLDVTEDERNLYRMKSQILEECSDSNPLTYDEVASMLVEHMKPPFGPKHLKQWLAKYGILTSANHKNDQPARKYINAGWFVTKVHHYERNGLPYCEVRYLISWFGFHNMLDLAIREKLIIPREENHQRLL